MTHFKGGANPYEVMVDPGLMGPWFSGPSWDNWRVWVKAVYGLPLTVEEAVVYRQFTGRQTAPSELVRQRLGIMGRRAGKSRVGAFLAVHACCFVDYSKWLAPGEVGTAVLLATDRAQARNLFQYVSGFFEQIPLLGAMVEQTYKESIVLKNRTRIEIATSDQQTIRGYTLICAIADECAFWGDDASATLKAIRPGLLTIPSSWLLILSSPYAMRGPVFDMHQQYYGKESKRVLVWQAGTLSMNPSADQEAIADDFKLDPVGAESEYNATFRADVDKFVSRETVLANVPAGVSEREPTEAPCYLFADTAGGNIGGDSFCWAVATEIGDKLILLYLKEQRPPFDPVQTVKDCCATAKRYGVSKIVGDRFSKGFVVRHCQEAGFIYAATTLTKSDLFSELLQNLNSGTCELLDDDVLVDQLVSLERKTGAAKDRIEGPRHGHDDVANAAAGALYLASQKPQDWFGLGRLGNIKQTPKSLQYGAEEDHRVKESRRKERQRRSQGGDIFDQSIAKKRLY